MHIETRRRLDAWFSAADSLLDEVAVAVPAPGGAGVADDAAPVPLGKLWSRLHKERDLELHVRTGWIFGTEFVQLLDFVPSNGAYANEILIEARLLAPLTGWFSDLMRHRGGR